MMPGVKILNIIPYKVGIPGWSLLGCVLVTLAIVGVIINWYAIKKEGLHDDLAFLGIAIFCTFSFFAIVAFGNSRIVEQYRYEVTVEDTVDINEFTERYVILEQREKIFLIEERNPEAQRINRSLERSS